MPRVITDLGLIGDALAVPLFLYVALEAIKANQPVVFMFAIAGFVMDVIQVVARRHELVPYGYEHSPVLDAVAIGAVTITAPLGGPFPSFVIAYATTLWYRYSFSLKPHFAHLGDR